jgi:hypothetical protein
VQRASLRGRRARREVSRVEGAKNEVAKRAARQRESPNFGATSDDFSTISGKFHESFTNFDVDVAPEFHEISRNFKEESSVVSVNLS